MSAVHLKLTKEGTGGLAVASASPLTDDLRAIVRGYKDALPDGLHHLVLAPTGAAPHHDPEAWLERAAIAQYDGGLTRQEAEAMADLFDAYHGHHFNCPTCISAGRGYGQRCATGLPLWVAYQTDPEPAGVGHRDGWAP